MSKSIKLLKAMNDIDEKYLLDYSKIIESQNSHENFKERVMNMKKIKFLLAPAFMIIFAVAIYVGLSNTNYNFRESVENGTEKKQESDLGKSLAMTININETMVINQKLKDIDAEVINNVNIPYFDFLKGIVIPEDFDNKEDYRAIYVKSNQKSDEYDVLNNYEFHFYNTQNNRSISIAFSDKYQPLRDYYFVETDKVSKIGDAELTINKCNEMYMVIFSYKGINFDIETSRITGEELIDLLKSIIIGLNNFNNN